MKNSTHPSDVPSPAEDEFRRFFEATFGPATSYVRRRASGGSSTDDIVGDAFATAWRRWSSHPADPHEWLPWMYGICRNVLRNHRRSDVRRLRLVHRVGREPDPVAAPGTDLDVALHEALGQLSELDREVIRLTMWEGLSLPEVALVLGRTPNAIAVRSHRARRQLAASLGEYPRRARTTPRPTESTRSLPSQLNPMENLT